MPIYENIGLSPFFSTHNSKRRRTSSGIKRRFRCDNCLWWYVITFFKELIDLKGNLPVYIFLFQVGQRKKSAGVKSGDWTGQERSKCLPIARLLKCCLMNSLVESAVWGVALSCISIAVLYQIRSLICLINHVKQSWYVFWFTVTFFPSLKKK